MRTSYHNLIWGWHRSGGPMTSSSYNRSVDLDMAVYSQVRHPRSGLDMAGEQSDSAFAARSSLVVNYFIFFKMTL